MTFVASFMALLQALSGGFTYPSFESFVVLLQGWVLARRHTVTGMILGARAVGKKHHSAYHRLFASAKWSLDRLGLLVFNLIEPVCGKHAILLSGDDTLARKRGLKIFGVGMHHDPLLSTRKVALTSWGHSWVILSVILEFPFRPGFYFSLPILFRLYRSKQTVKREGTKHGAYFTKAQLMVQMLEVLSEHRQNRRFHLIADAAYGGRSVLCLLPRNFELTSRLHLQARLYGPPPVRTGNAPGRPRKRGQRLPTPRQMLQGRCRRLDLKIYGRQDRSRVADTVARAYHAPQRDLRVVAVQPLSGGRDVQAFFSTCHEATAEQVLTWYAMRWSLECTIHDAKGHLGFEEPQGWTTQAVRRTAPVGMLLYSLIVLWFGQEGHRYYHPLNRPWYAGKVHPSFADMLATLRAQSVRQVLCTCGLHSPASKPVKLLLHTLRIAA
jgi:hypothetical protein